VLIGFALGLSLFAQDSTHRGRKYKAPPPTSRVDVTILRGEDGKPVENAAVIFQLVGEKGNMELKTNEDGKTVIDVLPTGSKVTVQVIAKGFKTYGGDYTFDKPQMSIEVKLKRPGEQYSVYKDHSQEANAGQESQTEKKDKSAESDKSTSKDDPAESAKETDTKPQNSPPQPQ
jgi:hypothetical protein